MPKSLRPSASPASRTSSRPYPCDEVELEPDAEAHAKILLCTASTRAAFSRRVENHGLPGGLSDSLWAAGVAREKARKAELAEPPEAFIDKLGKGPAKKRQGPASWQPSKRPKPAGSLVSADLALTNKLGERFGMALQGTRRHTWPRTRVMPSLSSLAWSARPGPPP